MTFITRIAMRHLTNASATLMNNTSAPLLNTHGVDHQPHQGDLLCQS
jgi:hypothetical protein